MKVYVLIRQYKYLNDDGSVFRVFSSYESAFEYQQFYMQENEEYYIFLEEHDLRD